MVNLVLPTCKGGKGPGAAVVVLCLAWHLHDCAYGSGGCPGSGAACSLMRRKSSPLAICCAKNAGLIALLDLLQNKHQPNGSCPTICIQSRLTSMGMKRASMPCVSFKLTIMEILCALLKNLVLQLWSLKQHMYRPRISKLYRFCDAQKVTLTNGDKKQIINLTQTKTQPTDRLLRNSQ